jgi:NAD(P)H-hydrate repair Nnr-like enzyme with NAD(P)H-hydrate epimerase domain
VTELVTSAGMQAIERDAIASGEVTGLGLMETAGRGVVDAILRWRPGLADGRYTATILCGPGNNGGDGYVMARLLRTRGWEVRVLGMGETAAMPPDARANRERWETMGAVAPLTYAGVQRWGAGKRPLRRRGVRDGPEAGAGRRSSGGAART